MAVQRLKYRPPTAYDLSVISIRREWDLNRCEIGRKSVQFLGYTRVWWT